MAIILPSRYQNAAVRPADMTQDMADLANVASQLNAGAAPVTLGSLDIVDLSASLPVPTTPTLFIPPTILSSSNIAYNPATGIVTFNNTATYETTFLVNVFPTVLTTIFFGVELDFGSGFVTILNSGRQQATNVNINGQMVFTSYNRFTAGTRGRAYLWASASGATFQTTSLTALPSGPLQVPALRQIIAAQAGI